MDKDFLYYCELLGVSPYATKKEVKEAYKRKREENKGCTIEEFEDLEEAYSFLDEITTIPFKEQVKSSYEEIKQVEKKSKNRHKELSEYLNKDDNSNIVIKTKNGILHVAGEIYHQFSKLGYAKKDGAIKYVIRNRKLITGFIIVGALGICGIVKGKSNKTPQPTTELTQETAEFMNLNEVYVVELGDTLSQVAIDFNSSQSEIKRVNKMESDLLYYGEEILIPHCINKDDIDEYTKEVKVNGKNLGEIAEKYKTDIKTLEELNDYIKEKDYNSRDYIEEETIIVPAFSKEKEDACNNQYVKTA